MCLDGVSHSILADERIQELMCNPLLDIVHKQVVMALYSLDSQGRLQDYADVLPVYLSSDRERCAELLDTIERAGFFTRSGDAIELTHKVQAPAATGCGCC